MRYNSFDTKTTLELNGKVFTIYNPVLIKDRDVSSLPYSMRVLLENLLRHEDGERIKREDIENLLEWNSSGRTKEILYMPARVLLQDFTGVPAIVDLAAMRDAMEKLKGEASLINPMLPCELIIDHSVQVDSFGRPDSFDINASKEFDRNVERYGFLKWGQKVFDNFKVVPPATGICHQVNLEYLARVVFSCQKKDNLLAYPDTLVGTDSHTTMINGIGVLGWGVGGIEAEAAMLGEPISLLIPQVLGFRITGKLPEGSTSTDIVLNVTRMLRERGVVGKFVEFYGEGLENLTLPDRALISNMSPEFGSTCAFFPIDDRTIEYLKLTGRDSEKIDLIKKYTKETSLFREKGSKDPEFSETLELDLATVKRSIAGPRKPHEHINLSNARQMFESALDKMKISSDKEVPEQNHWGTEGGDLPNKDKSEEKKASRLEIKHGSVVIAAITSCTNTSNPSVMLGAGLLAKKASELGLKTKPWVKTSFAPGSKVVTDYMRESGLLAHLEELGFNLVGYGCTTCIGNSGPLPTEIVNSIQNKQLVVCSVLSGNRNFEGRINPYVRANYLASPLLVVAYAIAGRMDIDLETEPIGKDKKGSMVFLRDIWPSSDEIMEAEKTVKPEMFERQYSEVYRGRVRWRELPVPVGEKFKWEKSSTYIKSPSFFETMTVDAPGLVDIKGLRVLALLGDTITTDHISPAGTIPFDSPAGRYLRDQGVAEHDFNSYGSRRGNHEVMTRGTFGNIRIINLLLKDIEGGYTLHPSSGEPIHIYYAAMKYRETKTPLMVIAGTEYGSGSSRDWAAKGTMLLGVKAVLAQSFERIHRSNLIGMGILPLQFMEGESLEKLNLTGFETFDILGLNDDLKPGQRLTVHAHDEKGKSRIFEVTSRADTEGEIIYLRHGGILQYVLRKLSKKKG